MSGAALSTWSLFWMDSLWRASWQGGAFILLVWAVCRLFPRLPAAFCCWLWWLACLKLLMSLASPAPLTLSLPGWRLSAARISISPAILPRLDTTAAADTITGLRSTWYAHSPAARRSADPPSRRLSTAPVAAHRSRPLAGTAPERENRQAPRHAPAMALLALWVAGVTLRLRAGVGQWRTVRGLGREARPLEDGAVREEAARLAAALGLRRRPPIRESAVASGPVVVGLLRPTVVLPAAAAEPLSPQEYRLVLAHELAHVRRRDLGLSLVPGLAQLLFFFHPLAGLACREWATAREAACDALALRVTGAPAAVYGRLLVKLATSQRGAALLALGVSGSYRTMQHRLSLLRQLAPPPHRRLRVGLALLIAASALGTLPLRLAATSAEPRARFAIESVKELAKPVTLTETKLPLGVLVRRVSAETGVRLSAAPDVADEPVAVVVKDFPAGRLLQELAALLDYRWHRRPDCRTPNTEHRTPTSEIWQDLASKQREEALRQALVLDAQKRFQEKIGQLLAVAQQPPARIAALQHALEKDPAVKRLPVGSPERQQWEDRSMFASQVAMPIPRALALLLGRVTETQWARLRADQPVIYSTDPAPGEQLMPEEIARAFRGAKPTWLPPGQQPFLGHLPNAEQLIVEMRQAETETQNRWAAATGYRAIVRVTGNRLRLGGWLSLTTAAEPLRGGAPDRIPHPIGTNLMLTVGMGDSLARREADTPERQAALANDPVVGVAKVFRTSKKRQALALPDENDTWTTRRDQAWGRWDQLPELARTYGVNFIADAYWTAGIQSAFQIVLPSSSAPALLYKLLDDLVSGTHVWDRHGDLIRLRSRTWFLDRPREIPLRLVRRWNGLLAQDGALPLDEEVRIVTTLLTDDRLDTLSLLAFDGVVKVNFRDLGAVLAAKDTLRLYAALLPAQQQALWRRLPLPAARMTPAQRDLLRAALDRDDSRDVALSDAELAAARLSLTTQPQVVVVQQRPDGVAYQVENVPATSATPVAAPLPAAPAAASPKAASKPDTARRYPVAQITFHYQVGAQRFDQAPITAAAPSQ